MSNDENYFIANSSDLFILLPIRDSKLENLFSEEDLSELFISHTHFVEIPYSIPEKMSMAIVSSYVYSGKIFLHTHRKT